MALTLDGDNGVAGVNGSATTPAIQGTDTNTGLTFGTDTVNVVTGGSTRATVDSSGNLGIGTTSPSHELHISGSGDTRALITSGSTGDAVMMFENASGNTYGHGIDVSSGNYAVAYKSNGDPSLTADTILDIDTSGNLSFNSGYGSVATAYGVRAWCNFNMTNQTITGSGNVSSITDISTGKNQVNFTTAMPDDDYAPVVSGQNASGGDPYTVGFGSVNTGNLEIIRQRANGSLDDGTEFGVAIIR